MMVDRLLVDRPTLESDRHEATEANRARMVAASAAEPPRPVFVIGSLRSGASLLTLSLGQHPNLEAVPEMAWLERFAIGLQQAFQEGTWRPETSLLGTMRLEIEEFCTYFGLAIDRLVLGSKDGAADTQGVTVRGLDWATGAVASTGDTSAHRPRRWVDGTVGHCFNVFPLQRLFPHARFLHIVRDVREVVASLTNPENRLLYKSHHLAFSEQDAYEHWLDAVKAGIEAERAFGSATVLRLRRDDLVTAPEATLRRCLDFLHEPFAPACLRPIRTWFPGAGDL